MINQRPILSRIHDVWEYFINDHDWEYYAKFKGGQGFTNSFTSKYLQYEKEKDLNEVQKYQKRFYDEQDLTDLISDNFLRLTALAGFERLIAIRQAYGALKSRFSFPDTNSYAFQKSWENGLLRGYFKGAGLNFLQFVGIHGQALYFSQKTNYLTHFAYLSLFEALTYPLDTIKTVLYSDLQNSYKGAIDVATKLYQNNGYRNFYSGLSYKLLYNAAFLFNFRSFAEQDTLLQWVSAPLWVASYSFLTLKTRLQLLDTPLTFQSRNNLKYFEVATLAQGGLYGFYRGITPFLFLNVVFGYQFYSLFSPHAQKEHIHGIRERQKEEHHYEPFKI